MPIEILHDVVSVNRELMSEKIALTFTPDGRTWTYENLDDESNRVANGLLELGVKPQQRVAILDKNKPEFVLLLFGASKVGAVLTPINWRLAAREIEYILRDSEAAVLIVGEDFIDTIQQVDCRNLTVIVNGDPGETQLASYHAWISPLPTSDPQILVEAGNTCCQMYTSGTTGYPKGVETTHRNLTTVCLNNLAVTNVGRDSAMLTFMPLFHLSGALITLLGLFSGGHTVLQQEAVLQDVQDSIARYQITHMVSVPAFLKMLVDLPNASDVDYSSLQYVFYGGSPITVDVMKKVLAVMKGVGFMQSFGLTESTGGFTLLSPEDHAAAIDDPNKAALLRSCGQLCMPDHEMMIVDPDTGIELADGAVGEVWVRGPQVMKGYWRNPEATSETITTDGWLRTGDAGSVENGYLYIRDRIKDMIISGGENIYPAEVENALMEHDHIMDATVIGIPHEKWGETVLAICVRDDTTLTERQLIDHCRNLLAHYKCPTNVIWRDTIPRNASGKVQKHRLRAPFWENWETKNSEASH